MSNYGGVLVSFTSEVVTPWYRAVVPYVESYPTLGPEGCMVGALVRDVFGVLGGGVGVWTRGVRERQGVGLSDGGLPRVSPFA